MTDISYAENNSMLRDTSSIITITVTVIKFDAVKFDGLNDIPSEFVKGVLTIHVLHD